MALQRIGTKSGALPFSVEDASGYCIDFLTRKLVAARLLQQNVATLRSTPLDAWACLIKRMHKIVRVFIAEFELMSQTCGSIFVSMLAYLRASPSHDALLKVSPRASTPR